MNITLKRRFIVSTVLTQLPLLAVTLGVFIYAGLFTEHFDTAIYEVTTELAPIHAIRNGLSDVAMALHDYLIGQEQGEIENFHRRVRNIDRVFSRNLSQNPFNSPEETRLFGDAFEAWGRMKQSAQEILREAANGPVAGPYAQMKAFDGNTAEVFGHLDEVERIANRELFEAQTEAQTVRTKMFFNLGALLVLGIVLSASSAVYLSRTVLTPVRELIQGTRKLAAKDLEYRIPVSSADEFGELGTAFNTMAERLDRTYKVLHEMATRDDLTLLLNAREFHRRLEIEISRSDRYRHPLSLIFIDVDHFKAVNDSFGHQVGDEVLRAVARLLAQRVRPTDHVARYGGEEFGVICPETGLQDAQIIAERIRVAFHDSAVYHAPTGPLSVSVSLGVSCFPESSENEHDLLKDADQALYRAKSDGRNCTRVFNGPNSSTPG